MKFRSYFGKMIPAVFFLGVVCLIVTGCESTPTVTVYTSVDQPFAEPVFKTFERETGIKVIPLFDAEAAKTVGLVTRLRAEANSPQADVFWSSEFAHTIKLAGEGLFASYNPPTASDIPEIYRDPESRWTGFGLRARVILVNTSLLASSAFPAKLEDLLDPCWKEGQIAVAQPLFGTTNTHAAAICALSGEDAMKRFFNKLKEGGAIFLEGNAAVRDRVAAGTCMAGLTDSDDALVAISRKDPVAMIVPDQGPEDTGTMLIPNTVGLIRNAPHPKEARALISFLVSHETELMLAKGESRQISVRTMGKEHPDWIPTTGIKGFALPLSEVGKALATATVLLKEIFLK